MLARVIYKGPRILIIVTLMVSSKACNNTISGHQLQMLKTKVVPSGSRSWPSAVLLLAQLHMKAFFTKKLRSLAMGL